MELCMGEPFANHKEFLKCVLVLESCLSVKKIHIELFSHAFSACLGLELSMDCFSGASARGMSIQQAATDVWTVPGDRTCPSRQ